MKATCNVCMHRCGLLPGQWGRCGARKNEDGTVVSENYGAITSLALDPVEKKPLRRFYPGSLVLSAGSFGCNLDCPFCQNYEIAQSGGNDRQRQTVRLSPRELVEKALYLRHGGNIGIAFTYNEPLIGWEFVRDTSRIAHTEGLKTIAVTNGSVSAEIADAVLPFLDALNIDLKGFTESYYKKLGGDLQTVKNFIEKAARLCHVELTTLIVPGENDSRREMRELSAWIASIRKEIPLHVTRFFPAWKETDKDPSPVETIYRLAETAEENLKYVYTGNC